MLFSNSAYNRTEQQGERTGRRPKILQVEDGLYRGSDCQETAKFYSGFFLSLCQCKIQQGASTEKKDISGLMSRWMMNAIPGSCKFFFLYLGDWNNSVDQRSGDHNRVAKKEMPISLHIYKGIHITCNFLVSCV